MNGLTIQVQVPKFDSYTVLNSPGKVKKTSGQRLHVELRPAKIGKKLADYFIKRPLLYICQKLVSLYVKIMLLGKGIDRCQVRSLSPQESEKVSVFLDGLHSRASEMVLRLDASIVKGKVVQCYRDLGLMDQDGQWTREIFQTISKDLSLDISPATMKDELDRVVRNIKDNPYLMRAIFDIIHAEKMSEKMLSLGESAIIKELEMALPFALALNLLTKAQIEHDDVLAGCVELWQAKRNAMGGSVKGLGIKKTIKLVSVEQPIIKLLKGRKESNYPHSLGRCILPLNILEATALEAAQGSLGNACAGVALAKNFPGKYGKYASEPGGTHRECLFNYPMPKQWSDLYSTWNMQFCASSQDRPALLSKLLISSVSGYQDNPRAYISRRAYALYSTLNFLFFRTDTPAPVPAMPTVAAKAWGQSNRICSRLYQRGVEKTAEFPGWVTGMALAV